MTAKAKHGLPSKRNAPKKTGSRGLTLANSEHAKQEFEGSLTEQDEQRQAKEDGDPAAADDKKAKVTEKGSSLLVEQPPKPKVVGELFEAFYLKPVYKKNAKGALLVGLQITAPIEKEHSSILPGLLANAYKATLKRGVAGQRLKDVPAQNVSFYAASDQPEPMCELAAAQILNAHVDVIQRKGEGESRKVHRLSFLAQVKHSADVLRFADRNYGNNFWIKLTAAQLKIDGVTESDEDEEDDE